MVGTILRFVHCLTGAIWPGKMIRAATVTAWDT
jgi:hypothetical protein